MAWEEVECNKCKKTYSVQMYGPNKTREWKIDNWRGICDDCKKEERAELLDKNKSNELQLIGSEKQIAWAMKIRGKFVEYTKNMDTMELQDIKDDLKDDHGIQADQTLIDVAIEQVLENTSASWWIDNRGGTWDLIVSAAAELARATDNDPAEKDFAAAAKAEAVVYPTDSATETIADIKLTETKITVSFKEKNDDFRQIIKDNGYYWDMPWTKKLSFETENSGDRVAEIGNALLTAGFPVRIMNEELRNKAISGDFALEHTRWISVLKDKPDYFYIQWAYGDDMYKPAKRIAGAKYDKPGIIVQMEHVDEVVDFAEIYQFKFSPQGKEQIARAQNMKKAATIADARKKDKADMPKHQNGIPTLDVPKNMDIDDELKD